MNTDLLRLLAPEHAPPAPGWWPPAPGWWVLALLTLGLLGWLWRIWRDPRRRPRRAALRELAALRRAPLAEREIAWAIESLLRRYAIAIFGRRRVARLAGERWLAFLGERGAGALRGELGRQLLSAVYGGRFSGNRRAWLDAAERFIRDAARSAPRTARSSASASGGAVA
jgi:Domain of unknown function (DUF4381)